MEMHQNSTNVVNRFHFLDPAPAYMSYWTNLYMHCHAVHAGDLLLVLIGESDKLVKSRLAVMDCEKGNNLGC